MESTAIAQEPPGRAIDRLAREQGRTKWWIANQLSISQSHLSRLISGAKPITTEVAHRLADIFGVDASLFLPEASE
jgi:plasmid maintenance system antidote protein VapI